jgi:hypothetical protein
MGLTLFDAAKSVQNPIAAGLFKAIVTEDELFSLLPFVSKEGDAFSYLREKALPTVEWVSPTHTTLAESTGTEERVTVPMREIASNFKNKNFVTAQQGGQRQVASQMMMKGKAVGRELADTMITGGHVTSHTLVQATNPFNAIDAIEYGPWIESDRTGPGSIEYDNDLTRWRFRAPGDRTFGDWVTAAADGQYTLKSDNPSKYIKVTLDVSDATQDGRTEIEFASSTNEPDGLAKMTTLVRAPKETDGDAFSFDILDELRDQVKVRENLAYAMPAALRRHYKAKMRALGGAMPEHVVQSFDPNGRTVERRLMAYDGIPIIKSDNIPTNETVGATTTCSSVYLVSLSEQGLYAGAFGGASTEVNADPISRSVLGFQFIQVGQMENENSQLWRAVWYGGFALNSGLAAARARGIKTA